MKKEQTVKKHAIHAFSQFELTNYLLQNLNKFDLTPAAKLVLLELSTHYNPDKPDMFPKQKTLALKIGVSERSVTRAVQELFKAGLIIIECKYTNRYKFTSKIGFLPAENEKNIDSDNSSDKIGQIVVKEDDKLSEHEQIKEQIKNNKNVVDIQRKTVKSEGLLSLKDKNALAALQTCKLSDSTDNILKEYAEQRGAKNINAYVNALKNNGAADKIIADFKAKKAADDFAKKQIEETQKRNAEYSVWIADNPKECRKLQEVLCRIGKFGIYA